ncbi:hypothetical protein ACM9XC_07285 [Xanthomonas sacchari]
MSKFLNSVRPFAAKLAVGATALVVSGLASAGEMAEAVSAGVDKTELTAIGVVVLTITGIILMIRSGKKAGN